MSNIGPGIKENSEIYFFSPSPKAKKLCYTPVCAGHFYCDGNYHLKRESFDSILLVQVTDGAFIFRGENGELITAKKNDTVIIDCYAPHEYLAEDKLEFIWVHIDGANCRELCREIISSDGNVSRSARQGYIREQMGKILDGVKSASVTEQELSLSIYELLLELLNPSAAKNKKLHDDNIQRVKEYITEHLGESITVEALSEVANMSVTNFSRVFRQQTGFSPYDYVLSSRLNKAKEYLLRTDMSVTQIAYETGFNSEANFICCFTKSEGISPGKFRKLKF